MSLLGTELVERARPSFRTDVLAVGAIAIAHAFVAGVLRARGFDHVSDDDFARVTIAEAFAASPRLDPSGTSWLPFPFWTLGGALAIFGRSLPVAHAASIALSSLAAPLPYAALRSTGTPPRRAILAVAFALLSPWSAWLGASTVPESFTASLATAAAIGLGSGDGSALGEHDRSRRSWWAVALALGLTAACLSRYEAWPVAAVLAGIVAWRAWRGRISFAPTATRRSDLVVQGVVLGALVLGPLGWMLWNAHAHGSATHFFDRVARYKRALGEGSVDTFEALAFYPRVLFAMRPDVVAAATCALVLFRRPSVRKRWAGPLACAIGQMIFLACGNARDGAPAHHPERALLGVVFLLAMLSVDVLGRAARSLVGRARVSAAVLGGALVLGWAVHLRGFFDDVPGSSPSEDRRAQIDRGSALRAAKVDAFAVTPCAFEHFALIAAYGAPERVVVHPKTGAPVDADCPAVSVRAP